MRTADELIADTRVRMQGAYPNGITGYLFLTTAKHRIFSFIVSLEIVHNICFEHVRVSVMESDATPSMDELTEVKDIFWTKDEEVHIVYPRIEEVRDGKGFAIDWKSNMWSLWRPREGWEF